MKQIENLVDDIFKIFGSKREVELTSEAIEDFSKSLAGRISSRLFERRDIEVGLRLSSLGTKCDRKTWLTINGFEGEGFIGATKNKFIYGDILEEYLLYLVQLAGHTVELRQQEVFLEGIPGHIDAIIDGYLVDVKSASSFSFDKFKRGLKEEEDSFGYLDQAGGYLEALQDEPKLVHKDKFIFLVMDKSSGKICLDIHKKSPKDFRKFAQSKHTMLEQQEPPVRLHDEADGLSGNRKLGLVCSYCSMKKICFPLHRTFLYSGKPRFLTTVIRTPDVPELL